ncbi:9808_t:CDS:2, partial [Gigaspora margarita]
MSELRLQETQGSCSTRYPLQEVCWQDNIQTNGQRIIDDYLNIYVTRLIGKQKKQYLYKILQLGFYPQQVKRTQQSGYPIPNEYIVGVKVNGVDLIAKTQYNSFGEVVYTITWDSCNEKNQSVSSNKSASNASALFLQGHNNSQFSGIILFGFDLECLERRRNQNQPVFKTQSRKKPFHELQSESQKNKRLKALASDICNGIESTIQSHNFHDTVLKSIELNINNLQVNFQNLESENSQSNQFLDSVVCACD